MRKRSTKEILKLVEIMDPIALSGSGDVPPNREKEVSDQRKKDQSKKGSLQDIQIRRGEANIKDIEARTDARKREKNGFAIKE